MERLHFAWDGVLNARDLGGLPTAEGRHTRYGVLVRSESTLALSEAGRREVLEHGVRTIVDLRSAHELAKDPNPFAGAGGVDYRHLPFNDAVVEARLEQLDSPPERYETMIELSGGRIAAIFDALVGGPRSVLFHCLAGRDRTGIVSALALSLAGVPDAEIEEDFAISDIRMRPRYDTWNVGADEALVARFKRSEAEARESIRAALARLRSRWRDVGSYLAAHGLDPARIDALRAELVEG